MNDYFKKEVLVSFSIIFGSMLIFGVAVFFLKQDVDLQAEKAAKARALISERAAILESLAELKKDSPAAARYKTAINAILVSQDQLFDFPRWLDGLARGRGVSLNFSFQGGQTAPSENAPGYAPFNVRINGNSGAVIGLLGDIEFRSPRFLVAIDNFNLRGAGDSYDITANGRVFFK